MKIYILAEVNTQDFGFNTKNVYVFTEKEKAIEKMKELYLDAFNHYNSDDDDPFAEDSYDYQFTSNYAYVSSAYYLDIFEKEI